MPEMKLSRDVTFFMKTDTFLRCCRFAMFATVELLCQKQKQVHILILVYTQGISVLPERLNPSKDMRLEKCAEVEIPVRFFLPDAFVAEKIKKLIWKAREGSD